MYREQYSGKERRGTPKSETPFDETATAGQDGLRSMLRRRTDFIKDELTDQLRRKTDIIEDEFHRKMDIMAERVASVLIKVNENHNDMKEELHDIKRGLEDHIKDEKADLNNILKWKWAVLAVFLFLSLFVQTTAESPLYKIFQTVAPFLTK